MQVQMKYTGDQPRNYKFGHVEHDTIVLVDEETAAALEAHGEPFERVEQEG